jgi:hypothetical protein
MSIFDSTARSTKPRELIAPGAYAAVLTHIIDLGSREGTFQDKTGSVEKRVRREVGVGFELTDAPGRPVIWKTYTLSFDPSSYLMKLAGSLQRRTIREGESVSLPNLLGRPALVAVVHKVSQAGKTFAAVGSVSPPLANMPPAAPQHTPLLFEIGGGAIPAAVDQLPYLYGRPVREYVEASPEYRQWLATQAKDGNQSDPAF